MDLEYNCDQIAHQYALLSLLMKVLNLPEWHIPYPQCPAYF
jgi:hypothetical protein